MTVNSTSIRLIKSNPNSEVYRATRVGDNMTVAVKKIKILAHDRETFEKYVAREVEILQGLGRHGHPFLPEFVDYWREDEPTGPVACIAMTYIEGDTLKRYLETRSDKRIDEAEAVRILRDVGGALAFLQGQNIIHRDVKSDNVIRREDGTYALVDLGVAREATIENVTIAGTKIYMAPELIRYGKADFRSDIFSLGVTLYEALAGELPWGTSAVDAADCYRRNEEAYIPPHIGPPMRGWIKKMLAIEPEKRQQSARALLDEALGDETVVDFEGTYESRCAFLYELGRVGECCANAQEGLTKFPGNARLKRWAAVVIDPHQPRKIIKPIAEPAREESQSKPTAQSDSVTPPKQCEPIDYDLVFVLHAHMPDVLGHGISPFGEDWLYEAAIECYLPLLDVMERLIKEGIKPNLTFSFTPILVEQLCDKRFKDGLKAYAGEKIAHARADAVGFRRREENVMAALADEWIRYYENGLKRFAAINEDIAAAFSRSQKQGQIEIMTSAWSHAFLPLLALGERVNVQISDGVKGYADTFGCRPRGFWLPECAYRPAGPWRKPTTPWAKEVQSRGIEEFLAEQEIEYFIYSTGGGSSRFLPSFEEREERNPKPERFEASALYRVWKPASAAKNPPAVLIRDENACAPVWDAKIGYPGANEYLDFHSRQEGSQLRYRRVTNRESERKEMYAARPALDATAHHAEQYSVLLSEMIAVGCADETKSAGKPVMTLAFDAELFGHWWHEGPEFLYHLLKRLAKDKHTTVSQAAVAVAARNDRPEHTFRESSWSDYSVWLNDKTAWMWRSIWLLEEEVIRLKSESEARPEALLTLSAIERPVKLLEASDWPFIYSTMGFDYAADRIESLAREIIRHLIPGGEAAIREEAKKLLPHLQPLVFGTRADLEKTDHEGATVLFHAAAHGMEQVAKFLIVRGANVNATTSTGWTVLHEACEVGQVAVIRLLLRNGVTLNPIKGIAYLTPLGIAARIPPHGAEYKDHTEVVKILVAAGADVKNGKELLYASANGHTEAVKILVAGGADVNKSDIYNGSPLNAAASNGYPEVVKILIGVGADINKVDGNGRTPLFNAVQTNHPEATKLLFAAGADVNKADRYGATPLIAAASGRYTEAVNSLIAAGADVNKADKYGRTPFDIADKYGRMPIADKYGLMPFDFDNKYCRTPLDVAASSDIKKLLRAHGGGPPTVPLQPEKRGLLSRLFGGNG